MKFHALMIAATLVAAVPATVFAQDVSQSGGAIGDTGGKKVGGTTAPGGINGDASAAGVNGGAMGDGANSGRPGTSGPGPVAVPPGSGTR